MFNQPPTDKIQPANLYISTCVIWLDLLFKRGNNEIQTMLTDSFKMSELTEVNEAISLFKNTDNTEKNAAAVSLNVHNNSSVLVMSLLDHEKAYQNQKSV